MLDVDKDFKSYYRKSVIWDDCGNRVRSYSILNSSVRAETPETIVIDVLNCCKWIRILNFIEIVISGMIVAIEFVVADILNCLGIAETTETTYNVGCEEGFYLYKLYCIEKVLSGMIADTEVVVLDVLHTNIFFILIVTAGR
jgi:hypothetical protein